MIIKRLLPSVILVFGLLTATAWADTYTGSISYGDGLTGATAWSSSKLSWTADNETNPGLWTYAYTFTVDAKTISYANIGVWKSFTTESIKNGTTAGCELGTFDHQGASTPGLPEDIYGMKCTPSEKSLTYSWSIVTNRGPMWDSFYAKSGKHKGESVYAYNTGFGIEPSDPTITNGNNGGWVLVPGMTYHEKTVQDFAIDRFASIRDIIAPEDETEPKAEFIGNYIEVKSEKWAYVLDSVGHQVFRPTDMLPHIEPSLSNDITPYLDEWMESQVPQLTVDLAKGFAMATIGANYIEGGPVEINSGRELIASKNLDTDTLKHHEGRTIVMFRPISDDDLLVTRYFTYIKNYPDGSWTVQSEPAEVPLKSYETAISFAGERVMRVESDFLSPEVQEAIHLFREGLANRSIIGHLYDPTLRLATFFSPDEWRFPSTAYSFEGEGFVFGGFSSPGECLENNPFENDPIPYCGYDDIFDFEQFRTTQAWRHNFWANWCNTGQKNGIRGNCSGIDITTYSCWQYPLNSVALHKDLGSYFLSCNAPGSGWRRCTLPYRDYSHCEGKFSLSHQFGLGYKLEQRFYDDLERNHVAMISTHMGNPGCSDFLQFKKQIDIWVSLHREGQAGLGNNHLRHLFLAGCSTMNWNHAKKHGELETLFSEWFNGHVADGIRTVCGADSASRGGHITGLHFFSHYNIGESISQSWFNTELTKSRDNVPVVVAYGGTLNEAASILFDDFFEKQRAGTGWVIAAEIITDHLIEHRACCLPDGRCADLDTSQCNDPNFIINNYFRDGQCDGLPPELCKGIPKPAGSQCKVSYPGSCDQPLESCTKYTGACCMNLYNTDECLDLLPEACSLRGGSFMGQGSKCPIACTEACCMVGGSCYDLPRDVCILGTPKGLGTNCASTPCP